MERIKELGPKEERHIMRMMGFGDDVHDEQGAQAIKTAFEMGYRRPLDLCHMARTLLGLKNT